MVTVLIVGASGVVGSAALERFLRDDEREVVAVSRRKPEIDAARRYRHVPVDLHDAAAAREALAGLGDLEDLVYAVLFSPRWRSVASSRLCVWRRRLSARSRPARASR